MTIKELEERTGLARANIRFYEKEGLICPLRQANGYRDYSEGDAETLEKVKLLRQLRLDLETIRRLQAGSLPLAQAMEEQMRALERDQAAVEGARQVCRRLRDSGLQYETLTPLPYLQELERAPEGPHMAALPTDEADTVAHPWLRLFARALGSAITSTVCAVLALVGLTAGFILGGFECPLSRIAGSSAPGIICGMLITLICAAAAHTVIGYICAAKKTKAAAAVT